MKDVFVGSGMQEVVNYSLSDVKGLENAGLSHLAQMKPLKVANPLRVEQEYLRLSLRPGLLANVEHNKKYHHGPLLMFEAGKAYVPRNGDLPEEQEVLAGVVTGDPDDPMDGFLRAKGVLEMMLGRLGVEVQFERGEGEGLHPGTRRAGVGARGAVGGVGGGASTGGRGVRHRRDVGARVRGGHGPAPGTSPCDKEIQARVPATPVRLETWP